MVGRNVVLIDRFLYPARAENAGIDIEIFLRVRRDGCQMVKAVENGLDFMTGGSIAVGG